MKRTWGRSPGSGRYFGCVITILETGQWVSKRFARVTGRNILPSQSNKKCPCSRGSCWWGYSVWNLPKDSLSRDVEKKQSRKPVWVPVKTPPDPWLETSLWSSQNNPTGLAESGGGSEIVGEPRCQAVLVSAENERGFPGITHSQGGIALRWFLNWEKPDRIYSPEIPISNEASRKHRLVKVLEETLFPLVQSSFSFSSSFSARIHPFPLFSLSPLQGIAERRATQYSFPQWWKQVMCVLSSTVATCVYLSTCKVDSETEEWNCYFNLRLGIDQPQVTILDSRGLKSAVGPLKLIKRTRKHAGQWFPPAPKGEMAGGAAGDWSERVPSQVYTWTPYSRVENPRAMSGRLHDGFSKRVVTLPSQHFLNESESGRPA